MGFNDNNSTEKKSPIRDKPNRLPGQSLNDEIQKVMSDDVEFHAGMFGMYVIVVAVLWINKFTNFFSNYFALISFTIVALFPCAYCVYRLCKSKKYLKNLNQGLEGELYVGQFLTNKLLRKGYNILHDIPVELSDGTKCNIDHVIISPNGIYTVETKTISKPVRGDAKIYFDDKMLSFNGKDATDKPVIQAKAEAGWIDDFIDKRTIHKGIKVHPVIIFPGWFINTDYDKSKIWILNEKCLESFISNEAGDISEGIVKEITYKLAEYCSKNH